MTRKRLLNTQTSNFNRFNLNNSSRVMATQVELTERCLQILAIPEGRRCLILDIGCGSGLSGSVLTEHNHIWIGLDISRSMLQVAKDNEVEGDLLNIDIGQGFTFRPGTFDYAISVSAIQWLCNAEKSSYNPIYRLKTFFQSLYKCLSIGARCCLQVYPDNPQQLNLITTSALENGFTGGVVVDFPHSSKAKKYYLFLQAGYTKESIDEVMKAIPKAEEDDEEDKEKEKVDYIHQRRKNKRDKRHESSYKSRNWIKNKKSRQRRQGKDVRQDTKYTGRRRKVKAL